MRTHNLAACALAALAAVTGCSNISTPKAAPATAEATAGDPVDYLYDIDHQHQKRTDTAKLVAQIRALCTDDPLVLEFTATNTAVDLVDAAHDHQDVYPVLHQLLADVPKTGPKVSCAPRLPAAGKTIKAHRS
ncbi:hypothetical protein ACGFZR_01340 [Streptomyces sp. NPDC048241]|uniref:hypothetical protein n=1 Tax=Streptomyces sp. NPDC048241 TaxID=3365521 RepID=UPI0037145662